MSNGRVNKSVLISARELNRYWKVSPKLVLHIGAHEAEELQDYSDLCWGEEGVYWVEALPEKAETIRLKLEKFPGHTVLCFVAWDKSGEKVDFNETNNGQSSSALPLHDHADVYPDVVVTKKHNFLTSRIEDKIDLSHVKCVGLVNLDIQGSELRALKGLGSHIKKVEAIYSEVNLRELYEGNALLVDMDLFLGTWGFERVDWVFLKQGWGDALWLRSDLIPNWRRTRRSMRNTKWLALNFKDRLIHVLNRMR